MKSGILVNASFSTTLTLRNKWAEWKHPVAQAILEELLFCNFQQVVYHHATYSESPHEMLVTTHTWYPLYISDNTVVLMAKWNRVLQGYWSNNLHQPRRENGRMILPCSPHTRKRTFQKKNYWKKSYFLFCFLIQNQLKQRLSFMHRTMKQFLL